MKRNPNCTLCPLHKTAKTVCLLGEGPRDAEAMVIGEAPGQREDDKGVPFVGSSGLMLDEVLEEVGLDRNDLFVTNAVACRPPQNRTPKKKEIEACKKWLDYQMAMVKPKFVALLGNVALQSVLGIKGIKKYRGRIIEKNNVYYMPMYHPSFIMRGDGKDRPSFLNDFKEFKRAIQADGFPKDRRIRSIVVDTWKKVEEMIEVLVGVVSFDIETTCLYPWADIAKVVTLGFGTSSGEYSLFHHHKDSRWTQDDIKHILELVAERLKDCIVVMHNGKFDSLWMRVHYGLEFTNDFDTMLAHYLIDENDRHSLDHLASLYFGAENWDIPLEEKQGGARIPRIATYHAHDLYFTRKLYFVLMRLLKEDKYIFRVFNRILMPAARLFRDMELHGCYIDQTKMDDAEKYLREEMAKAEKALKKWGDINWGSPLQVAHLLYDELGIKCPMKTKKGANSTSESALKQVDHPAVADLLKFRGHKQQLSFFIEGWKPYIKDHRIHPSFKLHGTTTGRPSCEHPNFQQVPRDPRIRTLVTAPPPNYVIVEADLSQIELRLVAHLSQVPAMVDAFNTGKDIHWKTALSELERYAGMADVVKETARVAKQLKKPPSYAEAMEILMEIGPDAAADIDPVWKELRKKAKAINFGFVYGMWWKKFRIYARDNYDLHITDEEAQDSRTAFFDTYPLEDWHRKQQRFSRENGFVRTLSGRKRRLPDATGRHDTPQRAEAWRQAINSPIQGFASDLNLMVLLQMAQEFPDRKIFQPIITVHDAILAEVHVNHVKRVVDRFEEIMRGPDLLKEFNIRLSVPLAGDTKVGPWGAGVSLSRWEQSRHKGVR